jgi:3-oxoacyl-[acyl-carrier-protein] synthase III
MAKSVGFVGLGYAVPERTRANADPIFKHARRGAVANGVSEAELFTGVLERRVVADGETAEGLTIAAARVALQASKIDPRKIDRVYGSVSPSANLLPNGLFEVHRQLELPMTTMVLPVNTDFTNFVVSCGLAKEAISSGACEYVLVACGSAWTQNLDYVNPHAWSVGDGAAAAVLGPSGRLQWLGHGLATHSAAVESMTLRSRPLDGGDGAVLSKPTFLISAQGIQAFLELGMSEPPRLLLSLMREHGVSADNLTLVSHQASARLMDRWAQQIQPRAYLSTLAELGNMTLATIGVNLAMHHDKITTDYVGCIALGAGQHFAVGLIKT